MWTSLKWIVLRLVGWIDMIDETADVSATEELSLEKNTE
jgi:hypothetical protein